MRYWVYVHTCKANGKRYVGITTASKPEYRWQKGKGYWYNKHFYSAILKHGWNNFQHEAWELTCESEMYYAEKYLIAYYHTTESEFGYNHSPGGEKSFLGCKHSEETRKKMSEACRKKWSDSEFREKQSEAHRGRSFSEEHRKKLSESHKGKPGKPLSEETKGRIAETNRRRAKDPEFRRKMSEAQKKVQKKVHADPEYRKKIAEAMKGKPFSEEHRKRVAESNRRRAQDPEYRKKMSEIQKNRPKIKIKLPDGTVLEITKQNLARHYINKGKKFEYVD